MLFQKTTMMLDIWNFRIICMPNLGVHIIKINDQEKKQTISHSWVNAKSILRQWSNRSQKKSFSWLEKFKELQIWPKSISFIPHLKHTRGVKERGGGGNKIIENNSSKKRVRSFISNYWNDISSWKFEFWAMAIKLTLKTTNNIHHQFITKYLLKDLRTVEQNCMKKYANQSVTWYAFRQNTNSI